MRGKLRLANWGLALAPALRSSSCAALLASAATVWTMAPAARALDVNLQIRGSSDTLRDAIRGASLLYSSQDEDGVDTQDLFASARADYGRILGALYAEGYYSGVIRILLDGREAAAIPPLDAPDRIGAITIEVDPGPHFRFSRAEAAPLARGTELPEGFAVGQRARSGEIVGAADAGAEAWRAAGHAKVRVGRQQVTADHRNATLDARIGFDPGPRVTFGKMAITGNERVRSRRIDKIAGFPTGEIYDPEELEDVADRTQSAMPGFDRVPPLRWHEETVRHYVQLDGRVGLTYDPALPASFEAAMAHPLPELWPLFDACEGLPLALIRGEASDVLARATAAEMRRRRPDMLFAEVPWRGHIPFLDEPAAISVIVKWLAQVRDFASASPPAPLAETPG